MRLKLVIVALTLFTIPFVVWAQEGATIAGKITDENGNPLIGANVVLEGTAFGAASGPDGVFQFMVPPATVRGQESKLTVRYIGYRSETRIMVLRPGTISIDFSLGIDVLSLEEIVVTGMGIGIQKEKLGVTIEKVHAQEIVNSDEGNVVSALHGKVANVEITSTSGEPGAATYIRIRGANTIQGGTQPLMVVDGSPINNATIVGGNSTGAHGGITPSNRASDINPEDIESIEILKGAAASAIYGSRAANGVVLITTKSGRPGEVKVSFKTSYTFDKVNKFVPLQRTYGQGNNGTFQAGYPHSWGEKLADGAETFNHSEEMFETGHVLENNLTISGGNERTTYYMSAARYNQDGVIKGNSDYERTTLRLKGSQRIGNDINVTGNFAFADVSVNRIQRGSNVSGLLLGALRTPPEFNQDPYLNEFGFHRSYRVPDLETRAGSRGFDNPFFIVNEHLNAGDVGRAFGNLKIAYDPLDWLNISYTLGYDFSEDIRRTVIPIGSSDKPDGRIIREKWTDSEVDGYLAVNGTRRFDFADAAVNVLVGHQFNHREFKEFRTIGDGMSVYGFNHLENTSSYTPDDDETTIRDEAYFGHVNLDLWNQLYVTGGVRYDGSSTFGVSERRHWFPKFSSAWQFTQLNLFQDMSFLNFGKIRAAYGVSGRQPSVYSTVSAFAASSYGEGWGVFLDGTAFGFGGFETDSDKGNEAIRPERTKEYEFGLELAFLDNRIGLNAARYESKTEDIIFELPVPSSTGFSTQLQNAGVIENDGWELSLDVNPVRMKDFNWDVGFLWAKNSSLVKDLASDISGAEYIGLGGFVSNAGYVVEGEPYGVFRGEDFLRFGRGSTVDVVDRDGQIVEQEVSIDSRYTGWKAGDVFINGDGFPELDPEERVIGDPNPDWTGSLRNTFTLFNKLKISALFDFKNGGDVWNGTRGALTHYGTHAGTDIQYTDNNGVEQRGTREVFEGAGPGVGTEVILDQGWYKGLGSGFNGPASQFVEDGGYVKLREISVAYTFTGDFIRKSGLSSVDVRLSGRNLKTWTDYTGIDPETNLFGTLNRQGFDYFNNPQTRSYVLTARFNY